VSRNEQGELIIRPLPPNRGEAVLQALSAFDEDFVTQLEQERAEELALQEREEL
jgi:antitoxin VapB